MPEQKQIRFNASDLINQTKYYQWTNPGVNALLVECANRSTGKLSHQCLERCINDMLSAAGTGKPLSNKDEQHLANLVQQFGEPNSLSDLGIDLGDVGRALGMNDRERNALIGRFVECGIANQSSYKVIVPGEYVALLRELQERDS